MIVEQMKRVFYHKENGQDIPLSDPSEKMSTDGVMSFYANLYPILTNARISGPIIKDDEIQYRFESTMGTKG